jgi:hypothetical protein
LNLIAFILYAYITIKELVCHWQSEFQYTVRPFCATKMKDNEAYLCLH